MATLEQNEQEYLDFEGSEYLEEMQNAPLTNTQEAVDNIASDNENIDSNRPPTETFWDIDLHPTKEYTDVPWITYPESWVKDDKKENVPLTAEKWTVTYKGALVMPKNGKSYTADHTETYYTDKSKYFATSNIEWRIRSMLNDDRQRKNLPKVPKNKAVLQYAKDWTIRDMEWYIIVAANLDTYKRWTLVMTSLGPGRVYDTWKLGSNHFDIYTHRPTLAQMKQNKKKGKKKA